MKMVFHENGLKEARKLVVEAVRSRAGPANDSAGFAKELMKVEPKRRLVLVIAATNGFCVEGNHVFVEARLGASLATPSGLPIALGTNTSGKGRLRQRIEHGMEGDILRPTMGTVPPARRSQGLTRC